MQARWVKDRIRRLARKIGLLKTIGSDQCVDATKSAGGRGRSSLA